MRQILKIIFIFLLIFLWNISSFAVQKDSLPLPSTVKKEPSEIEKFYAEKKEKIGSLINKEEDQQKLDSLKKALDELVIKKELDQELLDEYNKQINVIKKQLDTNKRQLEEYNRLKEKSVDDDLEIQALSKANRHLEKQLTYKELVTGDLDKNLDNLNILKTKYDNILSKYVDIKKWKDQEKSKEFQNKMIILYLVIFLSIIFYIIKYFLKKRFMPKYEAHFLYFDLIHGILLISFLVVFFFYLFPQLYILLIFISGSLIFINASLISSFISSIIVFRKYKIGDVIMHEEKLGRIGRITPLFTNIRILNKYWVISNDVESIPNILLVRDKVMLIQEPTLIDHEFTIALSLENTDNIFKIIDEIKENILIKNLNQRIPNINPEDEEIFKISHTQEEPEFVKVTFIWRATPNRSRKIEAKIISYVHNYITKYSQEKKEEEDLDNIEDIS